MIEKEHESSWIGVDLDGTLAYYDGWCGPAEIGDPIFDMVEKVKQWIEDGWKVKIFTARADQEACISPIEAWLEEAGLPKLEITNVKDLDMQMLYDDRCVQVERNTGRLIED